MAHLRAVVLICPTKKCWVLPAQQLQPGSFTSQPPRSSLLICQHWGLDWHLSGNFLPTQTHLVLGVTQAAGAVWNVPWAASARAGRAEPAQQLLCSHIAGLQFLWAIHLQDFLVNRKDSEAVVKTEQMYLYSGKPV